MDVRDAAATGIYCTANREAAEPLTAESLALKLADARLLDVPSTPLAGQRLLALDPASFSPRAVASLEDVAAATDSSHHTSQHAFSDPPTPSAPSLTSSSAAPCTGSGQHARASRSSHASGATLSPVGSSGDLLGQAQQPPLEVDLEFLCERLKQGPLTGQVVAWGWDQAARLSLVRRTMPNQLFSSLWAATDACVFRMTAQDAVEILESWLTVLTQCPRHFRLAVHTLSRLATYTLPAAVKRMDERQLSHVAATCRDMALLRNEADLSACTVRARDGGGASGASPRDLLQPVFGLVAAEAAWRVNNPARYVSRASVATILTASKAWSWRLVRHRDSRQLAALKEATAAALELLEEAAARPPEA